MSFIVCTQGNAGRPAAPSRLLAALSVVAVVLAARLTCAAPIRIDCIGDSITVGFTDNPTWSVPFEFGYRSGLYTRLTNAGYSFQFVGSSPQPWNGVSGMPTNTPSPDLRAVNQDHCEGYSGVGTSYVESNIGAWLAADNPDIILLMIGINDGGGVTAENNLNQIVQTVVTTKPKCDLIVAQITPTINYSQSIVDYDDYILDTLVPYYYDALGDHVTTVDQYANLLTNGTIDPTKFSNGINHPTNAVYGQMAQTWFQGIEAVDPPPATPEPSTLTLLAAGAIGLLGYAWRRRKRAA